MADYELPKPFRFRRTKTRYDRERYVLDKADIEALLIEALKQRLYLGGEPGTNNRIGEVEFRAVWRDNGNTLELSALVDTWTEDV